jgi:hypothetical protein
MKTATMQLVALFLALGLCASAWGQASSNEEKVVAKSVLGKAEVK